MATRRGEGDSRPSSLLPHAAGPKRGADGPPPDHIFSGAVLRATLYETGDVLLESPAACCDRRGIRRRNHQQDLGRDDQLLEPRGDANIRLHRPGDGRLSHHSDYPP